MPKKRSSSSSTAASPRLYSIACEQDAAAATAVIAALGADMPAVSGERRIAGSPTAQYQENGGAPDAELVLLFASPWLRATGYEWSEEFAELALRHAAGEARVLLIGAESADEVRRRVQAAVAEIQSHTPADAPSLVSEPTPVYEDHEHRRLGERLEALYALKTAGEPVDDALAEAATALRKGLQLRAGELLAGGRLRLLEKLGQGAVTSAWRAHDRETGASVAVKVLHGQWSADEEHVAAFFASAARAATLDHPGIAKVVVPEGRDHGFCWFATGYAPGGSLETAVVTKSLHGDGALQAVIDAAEALAFAHAGGVLHRDFKPSNVLLDADGRSTVVDFDLLADVRSGAGSMGSVYAAPETMEPGVAPDPRADVYALAMTLLFALNGAALPFWVLRDPERLIGKIEAPDLVKAAIRGGVDWDIDQRTPTVRALVDAITADRAIVRRLATAALKAGQHARAAAHLRALLVDEPEDAPSLRLQLARALALSGSSSESAGVLLEALSGPDVDRDTAAGLVAEIRATAERTGDWALLAKALRQRIGAQDPDRVSYLVELARIAESRLEDAEAARDAWEQVLQLHGRRDEAREALQNLARLAEARGEWESVVRSLRELLAFLDALDRPAVQYRLGRIWLDRLGDQQNALGWLERAFEGGHPDPELADSLERIRSARGEWRQVVRLMREQARTQPNDQACATLARAARLVRYGHGDADEAAGLYEALLERSPDDADALAFVARHDARSGRAEAAIKHFERLLARTDRPADEVAADRIAYARLLAPDRAEEALAQAEAALAAVPEHLPAQQLAADLAFERDADRSRALYEGLARSFAAVGADPVLLRARAALGELAWRRGDLAEAHAWFERVLDLDPMHRAAWWGLTRIALRDAHADTPSALGAVPPRMPPQEALARLLAALLEPAAIVAWMKRDPFGAQLAEGVEAAPLLAACRLVVLLERRQLVGPDLFSRLVEAFPSWIRRIQAVHRLWSEPSGDEVFPTADALRWAAPTVAKGKKKAAPVRDLDPAQHREALHAEPPVVRDVGVGPLRDALGALLERKSALPELPDAASEPAPEERVSVERPRRGVLQVRPGASDGTTYRLEAESLAIGSGDAVDVQLTDPDVEALHAELQRCGPYFYVVARGERGIVVNGHTAREARLRGGEVLAIGRTVMRFVVSEVDEPAPAARSATPIEVPPILAAPPQLIEAGPARARPRAAIFYREAGQERMVPFVRDFFVIGRRAGDDIEVADGKRGGLLRLAWRNGDFYVDEDASAVLDDGEVDAERILGSGERFTVGSRVFEFRLLDVPVEVMSSKAAKAALVYDDGSRSGTVVPLESTPFTIGRGRDNSLQIRVDPALSRVHCRLELRGGDWFVVDCGSSRGTRVNGEPIAERRLEDGDYITIGDTGFEFGVVSSDETDEVPLPDAPQVPLRRPGKDAISVDEGLGRVAAANTALQLVIEAFDSVGGPGKGCAALQLTLQSTPRAHGPLFDDVEVRQGGLDGLSIVYNTLQRPESEQRRQLNAALTDLVDRTLQVACDGGLPDAEVDRLLERLAPLGWREALRV